MPLTIAHPAAVLPLRGTRLPFAALVVGSLTPDIEYLFHLTPSGHIGHTLAGLLTFCLPAGLVSLVIVERLWARPAAALMGRAGSSFEPLSSRFALTCVALLIGALSHLAWDSFTHPHGWMVEWVPLLRMTLWESPWGSLKVFKVLQHGSTATGLAVVAIAVRPVFRALSPRAWRVVGILTATSLAGGTIIALIKGWPPADFAGARALVGVGVVGSFAVFVVETTVASALWRLNQHRWEGR